MTQCDSWDEYRHTHIQRLEQSLVNGRKLWLELVQQTNTFSLGEDEKESNSSSNYSVSYSHNHGALLHNGKHVLLKQSSGKKKRKHQTKTFENNKKYYDYVLLTNEYVELVLVVLINTISM